MENKATENENATVNEVPMNNMVYYNDTGRTVSIHPGMDERVEYKKGLIHHGKMIRFSYPEKLTPIIKMWDCGRAKGLQILIMLVDVGSLAIENDEEE